MQLSDCYFLGTIVKKHGLKGHLVLKLDTDQPEMYYKMESFWMEIHHNLIPFFVKEITVLQDDLLKILLDETAFSTEEMIGAKTYLPLKSLPILTGKSFYYHEVIGFYIIDNTIEAGIIIAVNEAISNPYFIIKSKELKEIIIPIIKDWIIEVNREQKFIRMNLPQGILEL